MGYLVGWAIVGAMKCPPAFGQIVRITLQHQLLMIFPRSRPTLLLPQLLADKIE
ncbi:MAG: hypothetical protein KME15_09685 [Drouetiella hepatica Uher 2000/2452]|uniref:Uncharacterized protein n=1 Tax=Drouetiella hepatica Uher 2000/2452 TaxID=904376 RepID=A0A951QBW3_9CYAN|nr:hypothetical protein [Drouetiella hepatica Uher 2000/2452]